MTDDRIATMNAQLSAMQEELPRVTDEARFDELTAAIQKLQKNLYLEEARRRQAAETTAEAQHQARIQQHEAGLAQLKKLQEAIDKQDREIFAALEKFTRLHSDHFTDSQKAALLAEKLRKEAAELDLPEVPATPMVIAGMPVYGMRSEEAAVQILKQYFLAAGHIEDAQRNGQPAPDRPGIDWYAKGQGQFWPRQT